MTHATTTAGQEVVSLRSLDQLPGPRGLPLIGNLLDIRAGRWHHVLERWARRHGPLAVYRIGTRRFLIVSDPDLVRTVLRSRPDTYRRMAWLSTVIEEIVGPIVFTAEGDAWRSLRRLASEALSASHQRAFFPILHRAAARLRDHWGSLADRREAVDVQAELARFTVDCTTSLAFGIDMNTVQGRNRELGARIEHLLPAVMRRALSPLPYWRWVRLPEDRRLDRALAELRAEIATWIARARARLDQRTESAAVDPPPAGGPANFLEAMILARDEQGRPYSDPAIVASSIGMLVAGEDTTANSISWAIHHLCERPDLYARLRNEADAALGRAGVAETPDQLRALSWTGAVASEALRVRPVAAWLSLEAGVDTVLGDVRVPRGTPVMVVNRPTRARREAGEGERTAAFEPERWVGPAAAAAREADLAFGDGPRICPGRSLAFLEMRLALSMLARNFDLERIGDADAVEEVSRFTMVPVGLRVRLRRRDG